MYFKKVNQIIFVRLNVVINYEDYLYRLEKLAELSVYFVKIVLEKDGVWFGVVQEVKDSEMQLVSILCIKDLQVVIIVVKVIVGKTV